MSFVIKNIGDSGGNGHDITVNFMDNGAIVLESYNPDTAESQRIVMLRQQWKALLGMLLENYGTRHCRFHATNGQCLADTQNIA